MRRILLHNGEFKAAEPVDCDTSFVKKLIALEAHQIGLRTVEGVQVEISTTEPGLIGTIFADSRYDVSFAAATDGWGSRFAWAWLNQAYFHWFEPGSEIPDFPPEPTDYPWLAELRWRAPRPSKQVRRLPPGIARAWMESRMG